ncbi:MAG: thioesterase family protein [Lentimicrobiaceae bacterium]|nr:thioesterase family protein [Lentimicrobiaceae bacterium]
MIQLGITGTDKLTVKEKNLATWFKTGLAPVYATPSMIAFMEETSMYSVMPYLEEGDITVGISVNIKHVKACTVGSEVVCHTKLEKIEDNILTFYVEVTLDDEKIGYGYHERAIVDRERFLKKL